MIRSDNIAAGCSVCNDMDSAIKYIIIIAMVIVAIIVAALILSRDLMILMVLSIIETVLEAVIGTTDEESWWNSVWEEFMKLVEGSP